jgi:hypothetical protein
MQEATMEGQSIIFDSAIWKKLQTFAQDSNRPINELLSEAITEYLHKQEARKLPGFVGMLSSGASETSECAETILASVYRRSA